MSDQEDIFNMSEVADIISQKLMFNRRSASAQYINRSIYLSQAVRDCWCITDLSFCFCINPATAETSPCLSVSLSVSLPASPGGLLCLNIPPGRIQNSDRGPADP